MVEATDSIAIALREVTRRSGRLLWGDPSRLRSRLQYALGSVGDDEGSVLDAVVLAAVHEVPQALVHRRDISTPTRALSDEVGPVLSARAVALWARAVADMGSQEPVAIEASNGFAAHSVIDAEIETAAKTAPPASAGLILAPKRKRRRRVPVALGLLAILLIGLVGFVALSGDGTEVSGGTETRTTARLPVPTLPVPTLPVPSSVPTTAAIPVTAPAATVGPSPSTVTTGAQATAGRYVVVARTRLLDTRGSAPRSSATVAATSIRGLPGLAGITAVILAVTVDAPSGPGSLRAVAAGATAGQASHLTFGAAGSASGLVFAPLATDGRIDLRLTGATAHLIVDAVGYAASSTQAGGTSLIGLPAPAPLASLVLPAGGIASSRCPQAPRQRS